jgi:capsid protein
MVRLSRWLEKNNGLYKQMFKDTAIYTVGDGITLQCLGGDYDWQSLAEAEWEQECEAPEVSGRFSMLECQYMISEAIDRDGEIFAIKTKRGGQPKFQLVETHRVETPPDLFSSTEIADGIRYNKLGQPTGYYVKQAGGSYSLIPAASMLHIYEAEYISQSRAYPPHQHAINNLRDEMDLLAMEKVAAKDNARTSRVLKVEDTKMDTGDLGIGQPLGVGSATTNPTDPDTLNRVLGGVTAVLQNNESLVSYVSARPSSAFTGFIDHLRRDSVMGGLPYEFVADPTRAGGASVRLVVAKAGRYFSHRQNIIIKRFLNEYFKYWMGVKIKQGEIKNAKNWWKCEWVTPKSVTVDAGRDAANERADLDMGRQPPSDDMQARGYSFEKTVRKTARDFAYIKRVSDETGVPEDKLWRKSPVGGGGGAPGAPQPGQPGGPATIPEGALGIVMPGPDGQPQIVPIDQIAPPAPEPEKDALKNMEPELSPPNYTSPIQPINEMGEGVDNIPKQNPGLSRSREQPYNR